MHDVEVVGVQGVTAQPGDDTEGHAHDGRGAGRQAVHAVGEVGAVGAAQDHDDDHGHIDAPGAIDAQLSAEGGEPGVVELVCLHEGNRGDELVGGDLGAETDGQGHEQAQAELEDELAALAHAFLVVLEYFDVVVGEADGAAPDGGADQQQGVDAVEAADQQGGAQHSGDDDQAAHRGGAFLLHLAFQAEVADLLADLQALQFADDGAAGEEGDQHADHGREHGAEGEVVEQTCSGDVESEALQPVYEVVQHDSRVLKVSSTISRSSKWCFSVPRIW